MHSPSFSKILILLGTLAVSGCSISKWTVKPHQRELLADRIMSTDDPGIRVGFRGDNSCDPTGVEVNITGGEEKTGCTGFKLTADTWYCFELHVVRDTANMDWNLPMVSQE